MKEKNDKAVCLPKEHPDGWICSCSRLNKMVLIDVCLVDMVKTITLNIFRKKKLSTNWKNV